jgi:hypothetical protein
MKTAFLAALTGAFALVAGCGGPPKSDATPTPSTATATATASAPPVVTATATSSVAATPPADAGAKPEPGEGAMCGGADVDLAAVLANRRCRPDRDAPAAPASASKDLKVTLVPSATTVAAGGHVDLALEIVNTGAAPIPLYFSGDLALGPEVKDSKGTRIAPPPGNAPKSSDPKCRQADCRPAVSHVVLPPGGKAHARVGWDAVKRAWPKEPPPGCCVVHVDPVAAGPLPAGAYKVKIPLPYETAQGNPADPEVELRVGK